MAAAAGHGLAPRPLRLEPLEDRRLLAVGAFDDRWYATTEDAVLAATDAGGGGSPADDGVLANDTGTALHVASYDQRSAMGALVAMNPDGTFTYDARNASLLQGLAVGESVLDTFCYTASDGTDSDTAVVGIMVIGINDGPTADAGTTYRTAVYNGQAVAVQLDGFRSSDPDQKGDTLIFAWDTDNDGLFGLDDTDGSPYYAHPGDAFGMIPSVWGADWVVGSSYRVALDSHGCRWGCLGSFAGMDRSPGGRLFDDLWLRGRGGRN